VVGVRKEDARKKDAGGCPKRCGPNAGHSAHAPKMCDTNVPGNGT